LKTEYRKRLDCGFKVELLDNRALRARGIHGPGALYSEVAAEVDPYLLTHHLLSMALKSGARIFDRTEVLGYIPSRGGVAAQIRNGLRIHCRHIVFSTGYEVCEILPRGIVDLKNTYALASEPIADPSWWAERSLIWQTGNPYLYARATSDNRVLIGGGDDETLQPKSRDARIPAKSRSIIQRFQRLCPGISIEPAFAWAGAFGGTKDGLPYIGPHQCFPRGLFALGFGGNGITFAEIASRVVTIW
jgi:glycine/D-amino acid oxidase-like deaminating enzyme